MILLKSDEFLDLLATDRPKKIPELISISLGIYLLSKLRRERGRSSDSWIFLLPAPSHAVSSYELTAQWLFAGFVSTHSGGSVPESHRLPYSGLIQATGHIPIMFPFL